MEHPELESAVAEPEVVETEPENSEVEANTDEPNTNDPSSYYPDDKPADPEPEEGEEEADEPDEDDDEEGDEPEEDIVAPVGLKAEHKELFAQLSPEAQRLTSEIVGQREKDAQVGVQKAVLAQREAERSAADQVAETQRDYAERYDAFVTAFAPQPPDPRLAQQNPGLYIAEKAKYDHELEQFNGLRQQIDGIKGEASTYDQQQTQQWMQEQHKELLNVPEYADEASRPQFVKEVAMFGNDNGYTEEELAQAGAKDIVMLKKAMGWKSDAEKWRSHMAKRNERPRKAGKFAKAAPAGGQAPKQKQSDNPLASLYPNDV